MRDEHQSNELETGQPATGQPETITVPQQANAETGGGADSAGRSARSLTPLVVLDA